MPSKIEIEYRAAVNEAVSDIEKVNTAVGGTAPASKQAGLSLTDLKSGLDLAVGAFKAVKGAAEAVINPTVEYAGQVRELGRTIGSTAEESSKLIQAADDVGISAGTLQGALQAAIRKGVSPTIEGIGKLADEYNAIQDPIARTKFLMDNFGRSGAALAPLMEKGAAGIKEAGDAAKATGLVMSQEGVDSARQYEIAMDNLNDKAFAFKLTLANAVIPTVTETANAFLLLEEAKSKGVITTGEYATALIKMGLNTMEEEEVVSLLTAALAENSAEVAKNAREQAELDPYVQNMRAAQEAAAVATVEYSNQLSSQDQWLRDITVHTQEAQIATENSTAAASTLAAGLSGTIGDAQEEYKNTIAETSAEIDTLRADLAKYQAAQGSTWTVTTEATASMAEYELAQIKAATAAQKLAEYTGDNREEFLQLQIASDSANEKVANLGTQMGISTTYTADYTTKIQEAYGSLGELNAKQAEAEAQLALTTSQFLFQQVASSLTKEAQLELANAMGLIDDESYNAAVAMQDLTAKYDQNHDGTVTATEATAAYKAEVLALRDSIVSMEDKTVNIRVNTTYSDTYLDEYRAATGSGRAAGGPVYAGSGYMVGELGPEPFFPAQNGYIMNHNDGKSLIGALESIAGALAAGAGATNNYYGYNATGDDSGQARALAGALA